MNASPHYGKKGILDGLFRFRSVRELLKQAGYKILETRGRKRNPTVNNLPRETISGSDGLKAELLGAGDLMAESSGQRRFKNMKRAHEVVRK
jgi:hypothetical protein